MGNQRLNPWVDKIPDAQVDMLASIVAPALNSADRLGLYRAQRASQLHYFDAGNLLCASDQQLASVCYLIMLRTSN